MLQGRNPRAFVRPHFGLGSSLSVGTLTILAAERRGGRLFGERCALTVSRSGSGAQREMGPALLPTPLSPAVGSRRNAYRLACPALRPKASSGMSPGARAGAGSVVGQVQSEDPSFALGSSETGRRAWLLERPCLSEDGQFLETGPVRPAFPTARPRGFNAPGFDRSEDLPLPFAPPRGISRSCRNRFQNPFFYQGVTPSIRRANPRFR